jgi:hypothetical protein
MNRAHLIAVLCSTAIAASACSGANPDSELFAGEVTPPPSDDKNEPTYTPPGDDDPPPPPNPDAAPPVPSDAGPRDGAAAACDPKDREVEPNDGRLEANPISAAYCGDVSATDVDFAKFLLPKEAKEIRFDYQSSGAVTFIVSVKGRNYTLGGRAEVPLEPGLEYGVQVRTGGLSTSEKRSYRLIVDMK